MRSLSKDMVGAFIDAVYAIAVTILALEIPAELGGEFSARLMGEMVLNYAISFLVLFALWSQHRRINQHIEPYGRLALWLNGVVLLLVCLIPRATTFVFEYGGNVTFGQIEQSVLHAAGWTRAEVVDLAYIGVVLSVDALLLVLVRMTRSDQEPGLVGEIRRSKAAISLLTVAVLALSLLTPLENRYFLLVIPLALMFEHKLAALLARVRAPAKT